MIETGDIIVDEMFGGREYEISRIDDDDRVFIGVVGARDEYNEALEAWEAKQADDPLSDHTENARPELKASHYDRDYFDRSWQAGRFHYPEDSDKEYDPVAARERAETAADTAETTDPDTTDAPDEAVPDAADADDGQVTIEEATSW